MEHVDTIIRAKWLITQDPSQGVLEHHAVVVNCGKIVGLFPNDQVANHYTATHTHYLEDHAILPGFVNAHTHVPMNLMRGIANDLPLMKWLEDHIWPIEKQCINAASVELGTRHAIAEMLRAGITCFNDMYFYAAEIANIMIETGIRGRVGESLMLFPTPACPDAEAAFKRVEIAKAACANQTLVDVNVSAHAPYTTDDALLKKAHAAAQHYQVPLHIHVHETTGEVSDFVAANGMRPLAKMQQLGLCDQRLIAVHMTALNEQDMQIMANSKAHVVHCPESNMKLSSGACPVQKLLDMGINVALGTDGVASNNDLDMIGEMRSAAFMAKLVDQNPESLSAHTALEMATINGAKAMGWDEQIGSLEIGKAADIIAIDLNRIETIPTFDPISQIVYAANRDQVTDVWVAGKQLLKNRELTTIDIERLTHDIQQWQKAAQLLQLPQ